MIDFTREPETFLEGQARRRAESDALVNEIIEKTAMATIDSAIKMAESKSYTQTLTIQDLNNLKDMIKEELDK